MSTIFRGVFSEVFGGIPTVRGFAYFSDLAKHSQPNEAYQRQPYSDHQAKIEQFYRNKHDLFFPELVFALALDQISLNAGKYQFATNEAGVRIKITGTRTASNLERVNLTLPDLVVGKRLLQRIDGNHRLRAYENLGDTEFDRYLVPFCIVLLRKDQAITTEKALFFNINSKAKPLTSEEIYRSIIDDEIGFPDAELQRDFGPEFVLCRQTRKLLDFVYLLSNLRGVFGQNAGQADDCRCSVLIEALRDLQSERSRLLDASPLPSADVLLRIIQKLNTTYADKRLQRANALGLFSAFLFFAIQSESRYRQFESWVLKNHQYELQTINASDLIRIFEKIAESRHRQIFVSMQFKIQDTNGQLVDNPNWNAIESAVSELNKEHQFDLELKPIRIDEFNKGYSYPISSEIFQLIEDSGYLIADLTAGNKNVYHEIGLLMGLNQAREKGHDNFLLLHNSSVGDVSKDFGFNIADFKQLRLNDTHSIGQQVKKQVAIYYGLGVVA